VGLNRDPKYDSSRRLIYSNRKRAVNLTRSVNARSCYNARIQMRVLHAGAYISFEYAYTQLGRRAIHVGPEFANELYYFRYLVAVNLH